MTEVQKVEMEMYELYQKLTKLRSEQEPVEVSNYIFEDLYGKEVHLLDFFGDKNILFLIHNMGQACRYCTLWADGLNAFLPHLESKYAVAMVSKDSPEVQRKFANERCWNFQMASHAKSNYIQEQNVNDSEKNNSPGIVCYSKIENKIFRKNRSSFGPGDEFCSIWNILSLAGENTKTWTPQYSYWKRPEKMDDGGENLN